MRVLTSSSSTFFYADESEDLVGSLILERSTTTDPNKQMVLSVLLDVFAPFLHPILLCWHLFQITPYSKYLPVRVDVEPLSAIWATVIVVFPLLAAVRAGPKLADSISSLAFFATIMRLLAFKSRWKYVRYTIISLGLLGLAAHRCFV